MFPSTLLIEFICLLLAIVWLSNPVNGYWRLFIWFMLFIVLIDGTGWILGAVLKIKNHWLYNIQLFVEVWFLAWVLKKNSVSFPGNTLWFAIGTTIFTTSFIVELLIDGFFKYADLTGTIASVLIIVASCAYFYALLKEDDDIDIAKHPSFWIVTGVFIFYFSATSLNIFFY